MLDTGILKPHSRLKKMGQGNPGPFINLKAPMNRAIDSALILLFSAISTSLFIAGLVLYTNTPEPWNNEPPETPFPPPKNIQQKPKPWPPCCSNLPNKGN